MKDATDSWATEQEEAFFEWYEQIKPYQHLYNLRMAFDAGYIASESKLK